MRELSNNECAAITGGFEVAGPLTGVRMGLGPSPAGALLTMSFYVGYQIGTAIYNTYASFRY